MTSVTSALKRLSPMGVLVFKRPMRTAGAILLLIALVIEPSRGETGYGAPSAAHRQRLINRHCTERRCRRSCRCSRELTAVVRPCWHLIAGITLHHLFKVYTSTLPTVVPRLLSLHAAPWWPLSCSGLCQLQRPTPALRVRVLPLQRQAAQVHSLRPTLQPRCCRRVQTGADAWVPPACMLRSCWCAICCCADHTSLHPARLCSRAWKATRLASSPQSLSPAVPARLPDLPPR